MPKFTGFAPVPIRGPRALPFFGGFANILGFFGDPVGKVLALHRAYGDLAAVSDRDPALVCAFGAEHNRQVLTNAASFQHNTEFLFRLPEDSAVRRLNTSLVLMNGDVHRRQRRLMTPAFSKASTEGYRDDMVAVAETMLRRWPVGATADVAELLIDLTLCLTVRCLFGLDVTGGGVENLGQLAMKHLDGLTSVGTIAFPFDLPGTPYREFLQVSDRFEAGIRALVEQKRKQPPGARDVLSLLIHARDEDGSALTDVEVVGQSGLLFIAGHETTSHTLAWTLFLLAQHPAVLASVVDEVQGVLRGEAPTVESIARMPLVDRVLKESMRMLPATPVLFIRVLADEAPIGPFTLPRAANLVVSPLVTHRSPDLYPDPSRFRPERWEKLAPTPYEYLPFGAGPRMCLGAAFGNLALRLLLPMILQRFRLTLAFNARISRKFRGITMGPKHGVPMLIAPQDRHFRRREVVRGDIHDLVDLQS